MMMKFFLRIHTVSHDEYTVKSIQLVSNSPFLVQLFVETYTRVLKSGRSDDAYHRKGLLSAFWMRQDNHHHHHQPSKAIMILFRHSFSSCGTNSNHSLRAYLIQDYDNEELQVSVFSSVSSHQPWEDRRRTNKKLLPASTPKRRIRMKTMPPMRLVAVARRKIGV